MDTDYIIRDVMSDFFKKGVEFNEPTGRIFQMTISSGEETGAPKY